MLPPKKRWLAFGLKFKICIVEIFSMYCRNFLKISNFEKALKRAKILKKQQKKSSNFFLCMHFYAGKKNALIKFACFMPNVLNSKS